jgi:hypothetical protein
MALRLTGVPVSNSSPLSFWKWEWEWGRGWFWFALGVFIHELPVSVNTIFSQGNLHVLLYGFDCTYRSGSAVVHL